MAVSLNRTDVFSTLSGNTLATAYCFHAAKLITKGDCGGILCWRRQYLPVHPHAFRTRPAFEAQKSVSVSVSGYLTCLLNKGHVA